MNKNKDIKKINLTTPVWEFQKIVNICNEQSKEGYQLKKVRIWGKSTFIKDDKKRYIYAVDFNPVVLRSKKDEYIGIFEDQGWEFVSNTFNGFSMFRKEYKEDMPENEYKIYTDKESINELYCRLAMLIKLALGMFLVSFVLIVIGFIILIVSSSENEIQEVLRFAGAFLLIISVCWLPIAIFFNYGLKKIKNNCIK